MYAAVNQWSFGGMNAMDCLRAAAEIGFSGYEPALSEKGPLSLEGFARDAKELRATADALGMRIPSLACGLYWQFPFSSPDKAVRQRAADIARRQIDCAASLGAPAILVVPGTVGKGFFGEGSSYGDAYALAQEALAELAPCASAAGIVIGIENVWNNFLLSPLEMRRFLDEIGSPFVKAYFDAGNIVPYGDGADWIRTLGKRITCVHVKDFRKDVGTLAGFVPLLEGDVEWSAVMNALREIDFDGALTAEVSPNRADALFAARQASLALRTILCK